MNFVGYEADTSSTVKPMFCLDCGENVNRSVNGLTEEDMESFNTGSCALCGETFYDSQ